MRKPNKARQDFLKAQLSVLEGKLSEYRELSRLLRRHLSVKDRVSLPDRSTEKVIVDIDEEANAELLECFAKVNRNRAEVADLIRRILAGKSKDLYGKCSNCRRQISKKRLTAVPWATKCISCQEANKTAE